MKLREYETVIVADPDLSEEQLEDLITKFKNIIIRDNGLIKEVEKWGLKELAFKVKHKKKGYYFVFHYYGGPDIVEEVERNIKIDDRIIRFLTFKVSKKEFNREDIEAQLKEAA
jgi:small subunit ribosomal protein S6